LELHRSDIEQILKLIDGAPFDVIHIEWQGLKVSLNRGSDGAFNENEISAFSSPANTASSDPADTIHPPFSKSNLNISEKSALSTHQHIMDEIVESGASVLVKSPTVGMFYRRPEPSAPPFVEEGAAVDEGDTLCLIEVMKVFTAITSPKAGTVERIMVDDNATVEHDQILFLITENVA